MCDQEVILDASDWDSTTNGEGGTSGANEKAAGGEHLISHQHFCYPHVNDRQWRQK